MLCVVYVQRVLYIIHLQFTFHKLHSTSIAPLNAQRPPKIHSTAYLQGINSQWPISLGESLANTPLFAKTKKQVRLLLLRRRPLCTQPTNSNRQSTIDLSSDSFEGTKYTINPKAVRLLGCRVKSYHKQTLALKTVSTAIFIYDPLLCG